jgi:hypothetical protein
MRHNYVRFTAHEITVEKNTKDKLASLVDKFLVSIKNENLQQSIDEAKIGALFHHRCCSATKSYQSKNNFNGFANVKGCRHF